MCFAGRTCHQLQLLVIALLDTDYAKAPSCSIANRLSPIQKSIQTHQSTHCSKDIFGADIAHFVTKKGRLGVGEAQVLASPFVNEEPGNKR